MSNGTADGGYYTCIVVNEAGYGTDNVSLLVRPRILTNPVAQFAEVKNNVTLTCEADSFPAPNYQWEMMNRASGDFEPLTGQTSYVLRLESISYEEYGMYRCVATADGIEENATSTPALVTGKDCTCNGILLSLILLHYQSFIFLYFSITTQQCKCYSRVSYSIHWLYC